MADDNLLRSYRTHDPHKRNREPRDNAPVSDPLAELARLIGQTDPFAETRAQRGVQPPVTRDAPPVADDWRQHIERPTYYEYEPAPPIANRQPYAGHAHADPGYHTHGQADDPRLDYGDQAYHGDYAEQPRASGAYADEQTYDDPPARQSSANRRSALPMAAVIVCCAVVGTAGAYGYRSLGTSSGGGEKSAPVIVADKSPSKIVPASAEQKARTQERFAVQGTERLVPREEEPAPLPGSSRLAALPEAPIPAPSAQVQTIPATPSPLATGTTPSAAPVLPPTPSDALTEPKRVRTVPIRPDGGDSNSRPQARGTQNAKAAPPAQRVQAAPSAPLSLDPAAQANERPQQRATLTPPAPREGAPERASAPANGGYLVQLSSQRSESDARASFRGLQQKYPQLKSREPVIRRASLGDKGTYYRAMVGPFGSSGEAEKFCGTLKSAGGQCVLVRN